MCSPQMAALLAAAAPLGAAAQGAAAAATSPMATAVSILVLGGIGFQVLLLYLLTVSSKSTQRHTWQLVRHAVAVTFSALLLRTVHDLLVGSPQGVGEIMADMILLVASLSLVELGQGGYGAGGAAGGNGGGRELAQQANLRTWGLLCARLAGLAAARGWGSWQGALLWGSPWLSLLAVPAALLVLQMMYQGFSGLRGGGDTAAQGPPVVSEREIMALSSSFLLSQALHFALLGGLPGEDGGPGEVWQGNLVGGCLAASAMLGGGAMLGFLGTWALERATNHQADTGLGAGLLANIMGFGGAWCILDGARLIASMLGAPLRDDNLVAVLLALLVSALVFALLPLLQSLTSRGLGSKPEELVSWLAVLLGMSLAPCLHQTVGVVATNVLPFCPPATGKLLAVLLLGALLLPAWRGPVLRAELALPLATLAAPASKADLAELEANAQLLVSMLLSPDTNESELDVAHLKLKDLFRRTYAKPPPPRGAGLTRVRVTARGIEEVHDVQQVTAARPAPLVSPPRAQADPDSAGPPLPSTPPQAATGRLLEVSSPPPPLSSAAPRAPESMPTTTMANSVIGGGTGGTALPNSMLVTTLPGSMNSESPGSLPATPSSEGRRNAAKNRQTPLPWSSASPPGKTFSPQEPLRNRQLRENLEGLHGAVRATLAAGRGSTEIAPPEHGAWRSLGSGRSPTPPRLH